MNPGAGLRFTLEGDIIRNSFPISKKGKIETKNNKNLLRYLKTAFMIGLMNYNQM